MERRSRALAVSASVRGRMRSGLLFCSVLLLSVACRSRPPLVPTFGQPPPLRLDFQPPVDRVLTESVHGTRVVERAGQVSREEAEMTTETRFTPLEGGWMLAQATPSSRRMVDGHEVPSAAGAVLARFTLRMRLAADGTFVTLVGAESAREALRQAVPEGQDVAALERFFTPEALEARARREWEAKYGGLLQRNLVEGQRTWAVDGFSAGDTEVTYLLERALKGTRVTAYGDALVFSLRCLDAVPAKAPRELREVWEAARSPELTPGVTCEGEQVVTRGRFVPVRRVLTLKATVGGEAWTLTTESQAQQLQEEAR